jgi:hypothetical protein
MKSRAVPIKGRGGLQGCEILSILYYVAGRLIGSSEVVGLNHTNNSPET